MADETRTIGEAWARATRLSKDGQLHEATVGFLRLRCENKHEETKLLHEVFPAFSVSLGGGQENIMEHPLLMHKHSLRPHNTSYGRARPAF